MNKEAALNMLELLKGEIEKGKCISCSMTNYPIEKDGELEYGNTEYTFEIS